jgi:Ca2+-binding EF-hand superfamily protein
MTNMAFTGVIAGTIAVAAAAAAFGYTSIMEPDSTGSASTRSAPSAEARMIRYDTDKDGRISRPELDGALAQEFRGVDTNADGRLDAAEIQRHVEARRTERSARLEAWRAKAKAQGLDPRKLPFDLSERDNIDTLRYGDWNMDGVITPDEFGGRARSQFMRADRNGDGIITPDELRRRPNNRGANSA